MSARAPRVSVLAICAAAAVLLARASGASAVYEDPTRPAIGIAGPPDDYCTLQVHGPTCWGTDLSCVPPSPTAFTNIACQHTYIDDLTVGTLNGRQLCDCDSSCDCGGGGTGGGDGSLQVLSGPCHAGYASASGNASDCTACFRGSWSDGTVEYCTTCPPPCDECHPTTGGCSRCELGMKTIYGRIPCEDCVFGQYSDDGMACVWCSPGTVSNSIKSVRCTPCDPGTYQPELGQTACTSCPVGTFNPNAGSATLSACQNCSTGSSGSETSGRSACSQCTPGSYSPTPGAGFCPICPSGMYADYPGADHCHACDALCTDQCASDTGVCACPVGYFLVGVSCVACPHGSWSVNDSTTCTPCATGNPCPNCGQGYFLDGSSDTCEPCPFGEWSDGTAIDVCTACLPNCDVCDPGTGICLHCVDNYAHVEGNSRDCEVLPEN